MSFQIINQSVFDTPADAYCNSINVVGAMGAGIALEFKKRYPKMFEHYQEFCRKGYLNPGDCYTYWDDEHHIYLLGMAVKRDWRYWSTFEWMNSSIKSLKLVILENDIKSVNMPLIGAQNGRRGPFGRVSGMTSPPASKEVIQKMLQETLEPFSNKFNVDIRLCIPQKIKKEGPDLTLFLETK